MKLKTIALSLLLLSSLVVGCESKELKTKNNIPTVSVGQKVLYEGQYYNVTEENVEPLNAAIVEMHNVTQESERLLAENDKFLCESGVKENCK